MAKKKLSLTNARHYYRKIRGRSEAKSPEEFDAEVKRLLQSLKEKNPNPSHEAWVWAAQQVEFGCPKCDTTGQYKSPVTNAYGMCFRCGGKGYQNDRDRRRNIAYDKFQQRRYAQHEG
jgi:hypothetical protein